MEELKAAGVGEVGCVGVSGEWEIGVGCVNGRALGGEVPEAAIVGHSDRSNAVEKGLGSFGCARR